MINLPVFKKHHRAGISLTSKNHFGSIAAYSGGAAHLHYALPVPDAHEEGQDPNGEYGVYRCLVDIMGHKDLGGKTILYLVDGLWSSVNWGHPPIKWRMAPFNDDYPNSLFLSMDPVAIQSVGYDFLYQEFDEDHPTEGLIDGESTSERGPFPRFAGTDDFLHQAADPSNWPANIDYDPEDDGSVLTSLGVHEHWNNATDKQYTRNLGTGNGIELVGTYNAPEGLHELDYLAEGFELYPNSPNPFADVTTISYRLAIPSYVQIYIYNSSGKLVHRVRNTERMVGTYKYSWDASGLPAGQYICSMRVSSMRGDFELSNKMLLVK